MSLEINNSQNKKKDDELVVNLNIRSRTKSFFKGPVKSVTAVNATGEFDILPLHANFITLIESFVIIDKGLPSEKKIEFDNGVVSAIGGNVDIYVGV
ncbi:hypothetical protein C4561_00670 [candidate division WWE3 bacterium]|jgi:F0F1-type ATP synthase epsilon subunit|uniref:ATP synthase F1 complex delta/epsilon subunit N-terminal domain-containing protein n=1 Tax=candidate division WWE3 bacterium TaxID=2053526 RepID=A0A3A4ZFS3_UNCKA|nr:MAG: hypothetical protein C4561_00670 [candidate division WWE3 bacterium]